MKKITCFIVLLSFTILGYGQETYYYQGEEVTLNKLDERLLVTLQKGINVEERNAIIAAISLDYDISVDAVTDFELEVNPWKREHLLLRCQISDAINLIDEIKSYSAVEYIKHIYTAPDNGMEIGVTNEIILKKNDHVSNNDIFLAIENINCTITIESNIIQGQFLIKCLKDDDVFLKARLLYESGLFKYAEPNFVHLDGFMTNDPYFGNQWGMQNTGQTGGTFGADIEAALAHNITHGSTSISVAVVDQGVDLTHPDLDANLLPGLDPSGGGMQGAPYGPHGTPCAGIIAAEADNNNNNEGVAGVAPNCRLVPIGVSILNDFQLSNSIRWAAETARVDVISNSWGGGAPSTAITDEINWATNNGRNGLGCVVVFSAGNLAATTSGVAYPSSLPNVISVGALDHNGSRASYSQFGPNLDVTAPGGDYGTGWIWSTDIQGAGGYNNSTLTNELNYCDTFGGTSAACPHVAGVAALVLSVNPCLTNTQVQEVIERTCDKTGNHTYCPNTNGNWTQEVGYGRVNAHRAVKLALDYEHKATFNGTTNTLITTYQQWVLLGSCGSLPAAQYFDVELHKVEATFNIPYSPAANFTVKTNGVVAGNPNSGAQFATISNTNGAQVTASTYVYYVKKNALGQTINTWYPVSPSNVTFDINPHNVGPLYFQNRTENQLTNIYRNTGPILAGENVTSLVPVGKYTIQSNNNINFISKEYISLEPGFVIDNANQNVFEARIGGFNRCNDYPDGLYKTKESNIPKDTSVTGSISPYKYYDNDEHSVNKTHSHISSTIKIHPNPNSGSFKIKFAEHSTYDINIVNVVGSTVYSEKVTGQQTDIQLDNKLPSGTYTVQILGEGVRHVERITVTR